MSSGKHNFCHFCNYELLLHCQSSCSYGNCYASSCHAARIYIVQERQTMTRDVQFVNVKKKFETLVVGKAKAHQENNMISPDIYHDSTCKTGSIELATLQHLL